jgi:co-chaperonin GroES (HSP10)
MPLDLKESDLIYVVADRVLIKPRQEDMQTKTGLFLPPGVEEQEAAASGYIVKVGPGYAVSPTDAEPWQRSSGETVHYIPLQARPGDLAIYLRKHAITVRFNEQNYVVVPHSAILLLYRDEGLFAE